jgi:hypothetical protein
MQTSVPIQDAQGSRSAEVYYVSHVRVTAYTVLHDVVITGK